MQVRWWRLGTLELSRNLAHGEESRAVLRTARPPLAAFPLARDDLRDGIGRLVAEEQPRFRGRTRRRAVNSERFVDQTSRAREEASFNPSFGGTASFPSFRRSSTPAFVIDACGNSCQTRRCGREQAGGVPKRFLLSFTLRRLPRPAGRRRERLPLAAAKLSSFRLLRGPPDTDLAL